MANWKMNGSLPMVKEYIHFLNQKYQADSDLDLVVFPPSIYLPLFANSADGLKYYWGGQNNGAEKSGAFTGEIATSMLKDFDCRYILIGHSERRYLFQEDEKILAKKFHLAKEYGMIPVFCIGETLEQYKSGHTKQALEAQLEPLKRLTKLSFKDTMIAYEPVWAIGSGLTPTAQEIEQTLFAIKDILNQMDEKADNIPLLYGGSVIQENAQIIAEIKPCQGLLVGGASLKVEQLLEITQCIICC